MQKTSKALIAFLAVGVVGASLTACATSENGGASEETQTVKLGVVGASDPYWAIYEEAVEDELGIDLVIQDFG